MSRVLTLAEYACGLNFFFIAAYTISFTKKCNANFHIKTKGEQRSDSTQLRDALL